MGVDALDALAPAPSGCRRPGRPRRGRWACRLRGSRGTRAAASRWTSRRRCRPRARPAARRAGRRTAPRCRSAPAATCGRGTPAGRCSLPARRSARRPPSGPRPRETADRVRGRCGRPRAIGWTVPRTLLACVRATSRVFGVIARRTSSGSMVPPPSAWRRVRVMRPSSLHRAQRPADAVVFEVGGDDVIAVVEDALEGHVEGVGAVEGEDEALRRLAVEELVEQVPAVVEGALGGEGHLVAGAAGVGQARAREGVEGLVDGLGLGKTGGGVVEIDHADAHLARDHGRSSRTGMRAISWPSRTSGTDSSTAIVAAAAVGRRLRRLRLGVDLDLRDRPD